MTLGRRRCLIIGDAGLFLESLGRLLVPEFEVTTATREWALIMAEDFRPDVVVLDIGSENERRAIEEALYQICPELAVTYLMDTGDLSFSAKRISKDCSPIRFLHAVRHACSTSEKCIQHAENTKYHLIDTFGNSPERLSKREREIIKLLAIGHPMNVVARILGITPRMVAFCKYIVMEEYDLHNSADLFVFAVREGILYTPVSLKKLDA